MQITKKLKLIKKFYDKEKTQIKERYCIDENGFFYGLYEEFYYTGCLNKRCTYINGLKHGLSEIFDIHGNCQYKHVYDLFD